MSSQLTEEEKKRFLEALRRAAEFGHSDSPIHDIANEPVVFPASDRMEIVLEELLPRNKRRGIEIICISSRASSRQVILGSQPIASCEICAEKVWVAPSSRSLVEKALFVCETCLNEALRKHEKGTSS